MGMLVDGKWVIDDARYRNESSGAFVRPDSTFRRWITADGSSGFPAEAGRYQLLVAANCPWAHRTVITRRLKGLEHVMDLVQSTGVQSEEGWPFEQGVDNGPQPPRGGVMHLHEVYSAAAPDYSGRVTVPTLWDRIARTVVNNESAELIRMFDTEFGAYSNDALTLRPEGLTGTIDEVNEWVYTDVNNGVYRCGFSTTQASYEAACRTLFAALDRVESILEHQRYLAGDVVTEADVRLFPTLVRFDAVYYGLFKCNIRHLWEYKNLSGYVRDLYAHPGFGDTCDLHAFKRGYYEGIRRANPNGVIPLGPLGPGMDFTAPHDRDSRAY